jgi:ElaB/YqjD/DUF883 family membrane-anchored ribosome-binding protein
VTGRTTEPEVEELVDDIDRTRGEMTRTADEIGERLDPANIVESAKETVREATVGKVEEMATNAGDVVADARVQAREAGSGFVETIRRNPIPAALAGIGIGWLWMNRQGGTSTTWTSDRGQQTGRPMTDRIGQRVGDVGDAFDEARAKAGRTTARALDSAGQTAAEAADEARRVAATVPADVQATARDVGANAQMIVEENPLAVGAIALAVGTAVGLALPPTRTEQRLMGEASGRVLDQAQEAVATPLEEAEKAVRDAKPSTARVPARTS